MVLANSQQKGEDNSKLLTVQQTILGLNYSLRNTVGRRLVETHAPELKTWLNQLLGFAPPPPRPILPKIEIVEDALIQIDPELTRLAYLLDLFPVYRVWLYALRRIGDGGGWVNKVDLHAGLKRFGIEIHSRSLDRYLQQGYRIFWTYDKARRRVYLKSSQKVAAKLTALVLDSKFAETLTTNKPGVRRVEIDLSGSIRKAAANAYAAWFALKGQSKHKGIMISRETLIQLWGVSIPTLLEWEELVGVSKSPNFAQQADTSIENVPQHARLVRGRDGSLFVTWQLPNTYYAPQNLKIHSKLGNTRSVRESVLEVLQSQQPAENRGWASRKAEPLQYQGGSLRLGRLYFEEREETNRNWHKKVDGFTQVLRHLKKHQDIFRPHYVYLGKKGRVAIFERYDIATDLQLTQLWQGNMKANQDEDFVRRCHAYTAALEMQF